MPANQLQAFMKARRGETPLRLMEKRTGIDKSLWSRLEEGYLPGVKAIIQLHRVFDIEYTILMEWIEEAYREKERKNDVG